MRILCVTLVAVLISIEALAQTAYYDAASLRRLLGTMPSRVPDSDPAKFEDFFEFDYPTALECSANPFSPKCEDYALLIQILRRYGPPDLNGKANNEVIRHYRTNNPFFVNLRPAGSAVAGGAGLMGILGKAVGSIGGLDVTTFADGLAQFLVERTKEELNVAFFEKLKKLLLKYPEFKILFPNTNVFLDNFESWQYSTLINTLREGLDKDFKQILSSLIKLRNITEEDCPDNANACRNRIKELGKFLRTNEGRLLLSSLQLGNALQGAQKWPDAINSVATPEFLLGYSDPDFQNAIKMLNVFSMGLRSNEPSRHFITRDELNLLKSDAILRKLFVGLIYEQVSVQKIIIGGTSITNVLSRANNLVTYLTALQESGQKLQTSIETLQTNRSLGKDVPLEYAAIFDATNLWLQSVFSLEMIDPSIPRPPKMDELFKLITSVSSISHDVLIRNYHASIIGIIKLLDEQILKDTTTTYEFLDDFKSTFMNYATFGANVVNAETPEEVKEAIKAIAQPAGSSSVKKNADFNIALNAYVGFVTGYDNPSKESFTTTENGVQTEVKLNGGRALAVYAPVGITFSKGMLLSKKNPWSLSAFVSFIDIGSLVGYRFTNDSTTRIETTVKFANIFAPGINVSIGLPWVPISLGYGIQYIPSMQRDPGTNELYNVDYSGWRQNQFFFAVDIPIANFYTGKKYMLSKRKKS